MHTTKLSILFSVLALYLFLSTYAIIVDTKYGPVLGVTTDKANAFYGIPFAAPPVGKLRWRRPEDPTAWSPNTYDATVRKPGCPQVPCVYDKLFCLNKTSEDCLYLYIWTPLDASSSTSYPVMVFIHGGSFTNLGAGAKLLDGENVVHKGNVILVNIQYRLGALGFLLTTESKGNHAIYDQRKALQWVHENIKNFGGDPNQVTLFGQSAGAQSTLIHMMTEESAKYFQRVIIQSAPMAIPLPTNSDMIKTSEIFRSYLNCLDMECLYEKSVDEILQAQTFIYRNLTFTRELRIFEPWAPHVDGAVVPCQILDCSKGGLMYPKPMIIGTVTEDARIFVYSMWKRRLNFAFFDTFVCDLFPRYCLQLLQMYSDLKFKDHRINLERFSTDAIFTCSTRYFTNNYLKRNMRNDVMVYYYIFDHPLSFDAWGRFDFCIGHVCHSSELPLVFDTARLGNFEFTSDEEHLSNIMIEYFTNFAKKSDPNNGLETMLQWQSYSHTSDSPYMHFRTPDSIGYDYRREYCDLWDKIGYYVH